MQGDQPHAWPALLRHLHWWSATLILLVFPLGWLMAAVPISHLFEKFLLYQLHKTLGISIFGLAIARLLIRARRRRPDWDEGFPLLWRRAANVVHILLYVLVIVTPLFGYLTAATATAQVPTLFLGIINIPHLIGPNAAIYSAFWEVHRNLAIFLVVLASGHALAAVHNHLRGYATLMRMWRNCPLPRILLPGAGLRAKR